MLTRPRGRLVTLGATLVAAAAMLVASTGVSHASPGPDDEGRTPTLRQQLDEATRGFIDAQAILDNSIKRQAEFNQQLIATQARHTALSTDAAAIAAAAYRTGGTLGTASALLESGSADSFIDRVSTLNLINLGNDRNLRELNQLSKSQAEQKAAIDAEIAVQQQQRDVMAKKKADAERALQGTTQGLVNAGSASAQPAPRNANGTWPAESCTVREPAPATRGCVTPRMAHLIAQAKAAGFTRYRGCWREIDDGGDHHYGKACDYAAFTDGFREAAAGGADKAYGDRLANWLIANASRLGVTYIIWYRRTWNVTSGSVWKSYSRANGRPNADHTNHLHVSIH